MNESVKPTPLPLSDEASAPSEPAPTAKPVRRRRPSVAAVDPVSGGSEVATVEEARSGADVIPDRPHEVAVGEDANAATAIAKPRRRRVPVATGESMSEPGTAERPAGQVESAVIEPAGVDISTVGRGPSTTAGEVHVVSQASTSETAGGEPETAGAAANATSGEIGAPQNEFGGGERGRRRGRRDRNRGDRNDRAAADSGFADDDETVDGEVDATPSLPPAQVGEVFAQVVSGTFDAEADVPEGVEPPKRVLAPDPEAPKLTRFSRRPASARGATWKI